MSHQRAQAYPFPPAAGRLSDPAFARLREHEPLSRISLPYGGEAWLAARYADVKFVMSDPRFSRVAAMGPDMPRQTAVQPSTPTISDLDRPEHGRLRRLVGGAFGRSAVESLRTFVRSQAVQLIAAMGEHDGPVDLVQGFALPLPVAVIGSVLGVPDVELGAFRRLADGLVAVRELTPDAYRSLVAELDAYLARLVEERRRKPSQDVLGRLVTARDGKELLSERELISLSVTVLAAGYVTTASHLANDVFVLLSERELWDSLRSGTARIETAVEELLRIVPLNDGTGFSRVATEDVSVGGTTVRAGEAVFVTVNSANRDAGRFDEPERVDLLRQPNRHMAFGHGAHRCLGEHLARLEIQEALGALIREAPDLRLAVSPAEVRWKPDSIIRSPVELPVFLETR